MTASRPPFALWLRQAALALDRSLSGIINRRMGLEVYQRLDAAVYITELEARVAQRLYLAPPQRCRVIPHALTAKSLDDLARPQAEEDFLITAATIAPRKNTVLLAEAARRAQVPVVFLGKPYSEQDSYYRQFKDLVDGRYVRYPGFVSTEEKHRLLRGARGFVLLSEFESGCIAVYEAAAAGLPLLLSDLPWANRVYQQARESRFVSLGSVRGVAAELRSFYVSAHREPATTFPVKSWREIAECYLELYREILCR
jgi:glycosyltransferase involved in cell wall biosynthesis